MTKIVDVAMFSSLGRKDEIDPIINEYGMIIMDECHHGAATTVEDVIGQASAKYVYGLTAEYLSDCMKAEGLSNDQLNILDIGAGREYNMMKS